MFEWLISSNHLTPKRDTDWEDWHGNGLMLQGSLILFTHQANELVSLDTQTPESWKGAFYEVHGFFLPSSGVLEDDSLDVSKEGICTTLDSA